MGKSYPPTTSTRPSTLFPLLPLRLNLTRLGPPWVSKQQGKHVNSRLNWVHICPIFWVYFVGNLKQSILKTQALQTLTSYHMNFRGDKIKPKQCTTNRVAHFTLNLTNLYFLWPSLAQKLVQRNVRLSNISNIYFAVCIFLAALS